MEQAERKIQSKKFDKNLDHFVMGCGSFLPDVRSIFNCEDVTHDQQKYELFLHLAAS